MQRKRLALMMGGLLVLLALAIGPGSIAFADQSFHSERIPLTAIGSAPLQSGFVVDIHANGPQIAAQERYVLVGVLPKTTYQVQLLGYVNDPTCSITPLLIPEATLVTNGAGSGEASFTFRAQDVGSLHNTNNGLIWQITLAGQVVYQSACVVVPVD
jgi:hypothetical protein